MPNLGTGFGLGFTMEHRANGKLVAKQVNVPPPKAMTCLRLSCYLAYVKRVLWYMQLCEYHKRRAIYAERNRHKEIPERYRTGEDTPTGFRLLIETLKLRGGF